MVFSLGVNYVPLPHCMQVNALVGYQQQEAVSAIAGIAPGTGRSVGTNVALPWGFTVGAQRRVPVDGLQDPGGSRSWPDNTTPREDQTRILSATLLNRAITVFGFSPQVAFSNQVRDIQRATVGLQTQPRGNALDPAVLVFSSVIPDFSCCHARLDRASSVFAFSICSRVIL